MVEENNLEEQTQEEEYYLSDEKVRKLQNLKMFKEWSPEAIRDYFKHRKPKGGLKPEAPAFDPEAGEPEVVYDKAEYEKKYKSYMQRYRKEYDTDMNDSNDVQALESLVRLVIQAEVVDENIRIIQSGKSVDSRTLKNLGDFQRGVQMSISELQDKLGISRKTRKDRQAEDFPAYIRQVQQKAKDFWNRTTNPVKCNKCQIELARFWLNFPDNVNEARFDITCERCKEKVVYSL